MLNTYLIDQSRGLGTVFAFYVAANTMSLLTVDSSFDDLLKRIDGTMIQRSLPGTRALLLNDEPPLLCHTVLASNPVHRAQELRVSATLES